MYCSSKPVFALLAPQTIARIFIVLTGFGVLGYTAWAEPALVEELTPQQRNGTRIFLRGESYSGQPVYATLGDPPMQVSAKMLPCVNCHGFDGRGLLEAGVQSSNICWSVLTKPYGAIQPTGRRRSAYDEATIQRAITKGIDPSSNRLGVGMPQFQMDDADMMSLIAYIKRIETDVDPGITDTEIVVATILPQRNVGKMTAKTVGDLLKARFKMVNDQGGVYGRKLTLRVLDAVDQSTTSVADLRHLLKTEPIFAIIAPFAPGASAELAALASEREIPVIVPLAGPPLGVDETNRFVFYLHSGLDTQARVLVDDLAKQRHPHEKSTYAVIVHRGGPFESLAGVVKERLKERGLGDVVITIDDNTSDSNEMLTKIFKNADGVFLFGLDAEMGKWLAHAKRIGAFPKILMVSASFGQQTLAASQAYDGHLVVAFPNTNRAQSPRVRAAFRTFLNRHGLNANPDASSLAAYCATNLFLKGIEKSGRQLRRERLIRELEGLYEFHTGLTRDVTYGPTRRLGVRGAYVVTFDPNSRDTLPDSRWVEFED